MHLVNRRPPLLFFFPPFATDGGMEIGQEIFFPNLPSMESESKLGVHTIIKYSEYQRIRRRTLSL
jgi:hypothetical protein